MTAAETARRYALLAVSLFVNAFGIALIIKASLGSSPISTVPYVLSLMTPLSFGTTTFIVNMMFIASEFLIIRRTELRRRLPEIFIQVPILFVFSVSIDVSMKLLSWVTPVSYIAKLAVLLLGILVLACGIGWAVKAGVAMNAGEYIVRCIAERVGRPFGNVKLMFDCSLVLIALILSLVFLHGIEAIREGTVVAALLTGPAEKMLMPLWNRWRYF